MPRTARASVGGICYHAINRGNGRTRVFHDETDYRSFVELLAPATDRVPMRIVGGCLMPNHFHWVLWPREDGDLSTFMQWLLTSHVRRHHRRHGTDGHVWQGRFKAFPIQSDGHLLTVLRYVERNALRAGLVARAEEWPWSSLAWRPPGVSGPVRLDEGPTERPSRWVQFVNAPQNEEELTALRRCVNRGTPFGSETWIIRTARRLGLEATLRPQGRPKRTEKK
jgi:putative transposase